MQYMLQGFIPSKTYLPGQEIRLHVTLTTASPLHSFPPFKGCGLVQVLLRVLKPPAQLTEHSPQYPQGDQLPSPEDSKNIDIKY